MTYIYGYIAKEKIRICDRDLFGCGNFQIPILKKIKVWYWTSKIDERKTKSILGIQCGYYDSFKGKYIQSETYCGNLEEYSEFKELELNKDDFFTKILYRLWQDY